MTNNYIALEEAFGNYVNERFRENKGNLQLTMQDLAVFIETHIGDSEIEKLISNLTTNEEAKKRINL